jgi:hypothetical protein
MRSREKIGLTLLALGFVGVATYACSGSSDFGPQPFINDVPSSSTTAPPAPEDMDVKQFPNDAPTYDLDAAYAHTLCESTCTCDIGNKQYCVGQYTSLTFTTCDLPDAGDGGPPADFRLGCNVIPKQCLAGGPPYCPCIISSLTTPLPCLPVCEDMTTGQVELYCPNP